MDQAAAKPKSNRKYSWQNIKKDFKQNKALFLMGLPTVAFFIIFCYIPMGGLLMAFENYKPNLGLLHSKFVGIANFQSFFQSIYFGRVLRNTIILSLLQLCIEFPFTILFALLLNELASQKYKRTVQTISYMPNFISMVVVAGIIVDFCSSDGAITSIVSLFTGRNQNL